MTPCDPVNQKRSRWHCEAPDASPRAARVSVALAVIALAGGSACLLAEQWGPGLILVFAAVAGVMTAWQLRAPLHQRNPGDDHSA